MHDQWLMSSDDGSAARACLAEQQAVDARVGGLELRTAGTAEIELVTVQLGPHAPGMRAQEQYAVGILADGAAAGVKRHVLYQG